MYISKRLSQLAFRKFKKTYNGQFDKNDLSKHLRTPHHMIFKILVEMAAKQKKDFPWKETISTNNLELSNLMMGRCKSTIFRILKRLKEAKVILKTVFHGTQRNYEIELNKELLVSYDKDLNVSKTNFLENTEVEHFKRVKVAKRNQSSGKYFIDDPFNNIIMPKDKAAHGATVSTNKQNETCTKQAKSLNNIDLSSQKPPCHTKNKNIPKQNETQENAKNPVANQKENSISPEKETLDEMLKRMGGRITDNAYHATIVQYSNKFHQYLTSQLFDKHIIYEGEKDRSLLYVQENYFKNCSDLNEIQNRYAALEYCVDMAKRYIQRHNVNMEFIFPYSYLNISKSGKNKKTGVRYMSFVNVWNKWFRDDRNYKKIKEHNKLQRRIEQAEKEILKTPSISLINKWYNNICSDETVPEKIKKSFVEFLTPIYERTNKFIGTKKPDETLVSS